MRDVFEVLVVISLCLLLQLLDRRRERRARVANEAGRCGSCNTVLVPHSDDWVGSHYGRGLWRACPRCTLRERRLKLLVVLPVLVAAVLIFGLALR